MEKRAQNIQSPTFDIVFDNFYSQVLIKYVPGPEADEMKKIVNLRGFVRKLSINATTNCEEYHQLLVLTKEKQHRFMREMNLATFARVAVEAEGILQFARSELSSLGYDTTQLPDGFSLDERILERHLIQVNNKIEQ